MIDRLGASKKPICTYCTQYGHSAFSCPRKPRATMQTRSTLKITKPMNKRGKVAKQWTKTRTDFMKSLGNATLLCHYCRKQLPANEVEVDHKESRSRRPDLRFSKHNLVLSCHQCNLLKGSRSHDDFCKYC